MGRMITLRPNNWSGLFKCVTRVVYWRWNSISSVDGEIFPLYLPTKTEWMQQVALKSKMYSAEKETSLSHVVRWWCHGNADWLSSLGCLFSQLLWLWKISLPVAVHSFILAKWAQRCQTGTFTSTNGSFAPVFHPVCFSWLAVWQWLTVEVWLSTEDSHTWRDIM